MEETVLIVGAGTMGAGIAFVAAHAGYHIEVVEPDAAARDRGKARVEKDAARAKDSQASARIAWLDAMPAHSDARIAIEAVSESVELKRTVLLALEKAIAPDALLGTNTSSLSVSELADTLTYPQRFLGIHFFNPPAAMKLVEIVHTDHTSDDAIASAEAFVEKLGKTAVLAADTPGFIVNRVARPFYLQSLRALARGLAPMTDIDGLLRSVGFRMGPFELMDLIGLDVNLAVSESVFERTGEERLAPSSVQKQLVTEGRLGRKSGKGFYDYTNGDPERVTFAPGAVAEDINEDEIVAVIGFGGLTDELMELLQQRYAHVQQVEHDDLIDTLRVDSTIVIDVGSGTSDRRAMLAGLDSVLAPEAVIFTDAYATDLSNACAKMQYPDRLVGFGILGSLVSQMAVEIVDNEAVSDDALSLAQDLFASLGKGVALVADVPGLVLGRVVGSVINEAVIVVYEESATPDDVDTAMRLGTNYPIGPIAWGREIGGARVARILHRVAEVEGVACGPHRSLWVLDVDDEETPDGETPEQAMHDART